MLIKTVTTVTALNSAGQLVEALPVRSAVAGETDIVGRPVTPVDVAEDARGVPVRFVTGKSTLNSAGQVVDTIPVSGGVVLPIMPPSYTEWNGALEGFGYLGNMRIAAGSPNGTQIGRILALNHSMSSPKYSLSGDVAGLAIDENTGMISVSDSSQIVAATRTVTVTATKGSSSTSTTIQIPIVGVVTNVWYVDAVNGNDANVGNLPNVALKTATAARAKQGTVYWKRGGVWTDDALTLRTNGRHYAYGDPADEMPWINSSAAFGAAPVIVSGSMATNVINTEVSDLRIAGTQRCFYHNGDGTTNGTSTVKIIRCRFGGNGPGASANGVYLRALTHGAIAVRHCQFDDGLNGDGLYIFRCGSSAGLFLNEVAYNHFGIPGGGAADNLQIANENNLSERSYDFWIHHNTFKHDATSNSTKGNVVLENSYRILFEDNVCDGRYFCVSSIGFNYTIRNNVLRHAEYSGDGAALLIGESNNFGDQRWVGNVLENNWVALGMMGYNDPAGGWNRYDMEIFFNTSRNNLRHYRQNRPASGRLQYNVGEANANNAMVGEGNGLNVATGGDYATYTTTPNYLNSGAGPVITAPTIEGTVQAGQTVTMPTGYDGYFWCINDVPVDGATSRTFVVPSGSPDNLNVPLAMKSARLSAFAIKTDASGNTSIAPATFADGSKTSLIAV